MKVYIIFMYGLISLEGLRKISYVFYDVTMAYIV